LRRSAHARAPRRRTARSARYTPEEILQIIAIRAALQRLKRSFAVAKKK
jgi:hypothetical protein